MNIRIKDGIRVVRLLSDVVEWKIIPCGTYPLIKVTYRTAPYTHVNYQVLGGKGWSVEEEKS